MKGNQIGYKTIIITFPSLLDVSHRIDLKYVFKELMNKKSFFQFSKTSSRRVDTSIRIQPKIQKEIFESSR